LGVTEPLSAIAAALRDIQQGVNPKLFQQTETKNKTKAKHPTATVTVSACAAACMEILMRYKGTQKYSSQFVVIELSKVGITQTHEGGNITADTVRRWRDNMNVNNKTPAYKLNRDLIANMAKMIGTDATLDNAKIIVRNSVRALADSGTVFR